MFMEILTGSGGILSYLQDILGGILSSSTKKSGGDSVRGGFCPTLRIKGTKQLVVLYIWILKYDAAVHRKMSMMICSEDTTY